MDPEDAKNIAIPHILLASSGEDEKIVKEFEKALNPALRVGDKSVLKYVERVPGMHHGWMGARAKLGEKENKFEYERGWVIFPF